MKLRLIYPHFIIAEHGFKRSNFYYFSELQQTHHERVSKVRGALQMEEGQPRQLHRLLVKPQQIQSFLRSAGQEDIRR